MKENHKIGGMLLKAAKAAVAAPFVLSSPLTALPIGILLAFIRDKEDGMAVNTGTRKTALVYSSLITCGIASLVSSSLFALAGPLASAAAACFVFWPSDKKKEKSTVEVQDKSSEMTQDTLMILRELYVAQRTTKID